MSMNDGPHQGAGYPAAPPSGGGGKKWAIIALVVVLVAALGVGGFLFLKKKNNDDTTTSSNGEVFLTAAADTGQDPFSNASFAAPADPSVALAATGATPASQAASVSASPGDQPGLYGGTNDLVVCDADKMTAFLAANPDKANAWVKALSDDPNLRWDGGTLTIASIPAYLATLTPIVLVSDTRVTNHGFANGNPTELQSVLQKGTAVFVDKYGVPRVRCACGNPLAAPKATKSGPKYRNKAWSDFSVSKLSVVQANGQKITTFQIRVPAKPTGALATLPVGPFACVPTPGNVCKTPSGVSKPSPAGIPGAATSSSPAAPRASSPPTAKSSTPVAQAPKPSVSARSTAKPPAKSSPAKSVAPTPSRKKGTLGVLQTHTQGKLYAYLSFKGYDPNSYVSFNCSDSSGSVYSGKAFMDGSGNNTTNKVFCYFDEKNSGYKVTDSFGNAVHP